MRFFPNDFKQRVPKNLAASEQDEEKDQNSEAKSRKTTKEERERREIPIT